MEIEITNDERLPWHKPKIQRLVISLDTSAEAGSNVDGLNGSAGSA